MRRRSRQEGLQAYAWEFSSQSLNEDVGGEPALARVRAEGHVLRDDPGMEQASLVDDEAVGDAFHRPDLLEIFVRPADVSGVGRDAPDLRLGRSHEPLRIGLCAQLEASARS